MATLNDLQNAQYAVAQRTEELTQAAQNLSSAVQNLGREQDRLSDVLKLLVNNWE